MQKNKMLITTAIVVLIYATPSLSEDIQRDEINAKQFTIPGIITSIGINYKHRLDYSKIVKTTAPYRHAVTECAKINGSLQTCNAGTNKIPDGIKKPSGDIAELSVIQGVIKVVPTRKNGFTEADTYILYPTLLTNGLVTWESAGGSVTQGYAE